MYRGTTPIIEIECEFDVGLIDVLYITLKQKGRVIIERNLGDCVVAGKKIECSLTQDDTLKLEPTNSEDGLKNWLDIQVRYRLIDGTADATEINKIEVEQILKDGVI